MIEPTEPIESSDATHGWAVHCDRALLLATLESAAQRARELGHPVVASLVQPAPADDPLRIFGGCERLGVGDACYWEQPAQGRAFVALGVAVSNAANGSAPVREASEWRRAALDGAVIRYAPGMTPDAWRGPLAYGGFAFDTAARQTHLWEGFPAGLLVVPELLVSFAGGAAALTLNARITPTDGAAALAEHADALVAHLLRLRVVLAQGDGAATAGERAGDSARAPHAPPAAIIHELRPAEEWRALVGETARSLRGGGARKVVLALGVTVEAGAPIGIAATLERLRQGYPEAYVFAVRRGNRYFVGATPEQLARVDDGGTLHTMALAGTAPRGLTPAQDRLLGDGLLGSEKNAGEHAIVVGTIREELGPLVATLSAPSTPQLLQLANVQHLQTPIEGRLLPGTSILDVVAALHPTPAVGGFPREAALEIIRAGERLDRGWYAGPVGWVGPDGVGEFAVALRSALIEGDHATLFAGCGIVADSEPAAEYAEARLKLRVMLRGLGCER